MRQHSRSRTDRTGRTVHALLWVVVTVASVRLAAQDLVLVQPQITAGAARLSWNAFSNHLFRVESRDALDRGAWWPAEPESQWPSADRSWTDPRPATSTSRFYRVVAVPPATRGRVATSNSGGTMPALTLTSLFLQAGYPVVAENAVEVFRLTYETVGTSGEPTVASGTLFVPRGVSRALPLLSYQHGTILEKNRVPSKDTSGEYVLGLVMGSVGYVTVIADYLGLGDSPGPHPYVHAHASATAVIDMLRAGRSTVTNLGVTLNGKLFLTGYSQGGQATMAALRELESRHAAEFPVTACAPMAGPYDLSGTMADLMVSGQPYGNPEYLVFTLHSYNTAYRIYPSLAEVLAPPYDRTVPPLLDGYHSSEAVRAALPPVPAQALRPEFVQAFRHDPDHPLRQALRRNDLFGWKPAASMRMYHCGGDTTVPFANSQRAYDSFRALGASQVELIDPFSPGTHGGCTPFAFFAVKTWFDSLKQ